MSRYVLRPPTIADGGPVAELAWRIKGLDRNSSYAYLLWCHEFGATSVVAEREGAIAGFITGYRRPEDPSTLFIWQVAVHPDHRRVGLARQMLDHLIERIAPVCLEATVTLDNAPSRALFGGVARDHGADQTLTMLFSDEQFPDVHESEHLLHIEPLANAERP